MDFELQFSIAGMIAMIGWLLLLVSPLIPDWSQRLSGIVIPAILSLGYTILLLAPGAANDGGFGTLAEVMQLFTTEQSALAGWVHFLAFDLFIGAWACKIARKESIPFWMVLPCLPIIFMAGPAGLLVFLIVRFLRNRLTGTTAAA